MKDIDDQILKYLADINRKKEALDGTVDEVEEEDVPYRPARKRKSRSNLIFYSGIGVSVAVLLGFFFLPSLIRFDSERQFNDSYRRYEFDIRERGAGSSDPGSRLAAIYMAGRSEEAIRLADSLLYHSPADVRTLFVKGLAELDGRDWARAKDDLLTVARADGSIGIVAEWYMGLIDMKLGRYREAAKRFEKVKNLDSGLLSNQAFTLFSRLRFRNDR